MSEMNKDLIGPVVTPARSGDQSAKRGSPDKVHFNKDKQEQHHKHQRHQKHFSKEDPHVDLQA